MRLVVAMMKHETNTFSPVPTDLARFGQRGLRRGAAVVEAYAGTNTPTAAFLDIARELNAEVVTPLAAEASPSGPVQRAAYEEMAGAIVDAIDDTTDAVMLDLHGAMVAEHHDDGEGELLARIRAKRPGIPICVALDMHCNLTQRMVENCDAMIGYKTYPHVDMYEVGARVGRILADKLAGKVDPVMVWAQAPVLAQTLRMGTADEPMKSLQQMARDAEAGGVLAATFFGGFPLADIPDAGVSAVVVCDRDRKRAETLRDELLARAWAARSEFIYKHRDLAATISAANRLQNSVPAGKPVILLDHADNVASGGTSDVMDGDRRSAAAGVRTSRSRGLGSGRGQADDGRARREVTLDLGGKTDMPSIGRRKAVAAHRHGRGSSDGPGPMRGPMYTGTRVTIPGRPRCSRRGRMKIVVTSLHHEPWDLGIFTSNGIDPHHSRYLLLKSRIHYRAGFAPLAKATFTLDGSGVTTSDNDELSFKRVRRPIYPLDPM
jgi:microcystin degradation protein MlrC